jgi:hypothetical protein
MSKIYCGIGKTPKGYRLGSMVECLEKGKVNLYGLYKIDSKLVKQKISSKKKESRKDKPVKEMDIKLTQASLKGKITAFTREVITLEKEDDDRNIPLIKKIKKQIDVTNAEIKKLSELIKKIKDGKEVKVDLKGVEKKIPTVAEIKGLNKSEKKATKKNSKK